MVVGLDELSATESGKDNSLADQSKRVKRRLAIAFIGIYLAINATLLAWNAIGQTGQHPLAYFFSWDMYPFYHTTSSRPLAYARTKSGHYVELLPSKLQQFRWGTASRTDLDRGRYYTASAVRKILERVHQAPDDPIVRVYLIEEYWPVRFNLPDDLYSRSIDWPPGPPNQTNPRRRYWKVLDEFVIEPGESDQ